jgi:hypothetical protein
MTQVLLPATTGEAWNCDSVEERTAPGPPWMDLKAYFQLFWVPAIASAALMTLLWAQDGLSGRAPLVLASWFLLALAAQYLGPMASALWVVGLALQTTLAMFLLLKHRLGQL